MMTQVLDRQLYPEFIDKPSLYQIINQASILAACSLMLLKHTSVFDSKLHSIVTVPNRLHHRRVCGCMGGSVYGQR